MASAARACCARMPTSAATFTSIVFFTCIDAVRGFAGEDYEQAVVEEAARRALSRLDDRVSHHEVAADVP